MSRSKEARLHAPVLRASWALLIFALLLALPLARAGESGATLWAGLVYVSNEANSAPATQPLAGFGEKLKSVFGYSHMQMVSEGREKLADAAEHTLPLGKKFRLLAVRKSAEDGKLLLDLRLFQEDRLLVQTQAKLAPQSPLFLRGPLCDKGQLVIVLQVE